MSIDETIKSLREFGGEQTEKFGSVLIDPPWRFRNRTGKIAPEYKRTARYETMATEELASLPVDELVRSDSHIYLWCPNALLAEGLQLLSAWGFSLIGIEQSSWAE